MKRPHTKRTPHAPPERHERSRATLHGRVARAVDAGTPLAAIAGLPDMPSRATIERWLDDDPRLRARHVAALERQRLVLAEELVAEVDRQAEHARGRRRATALRAQVAARGRLLRLMAAAEKRAAAGHAANDDAPARGISAEGIAMLEKAAERFTAPVVPSNDDAPPAPGAADDEADDEALDSASLPAEDEAGEDGPNSASFPRPSFSNGRGATRPSNWESSSVENETLDARVRGHDEQQETPDEDSDEPQFHRLPLTVAEEEALKARAAGLKPKPPEEKKSPWKPDTPTYVRFDTCVNEVTNRRVVENTGMADFDPLSW